MRYNDRYRSMEEVQHSIIDSLVLCSELVDVVPQVIGNRPPQVMSESLQSCQQREALYTSIRSQSIEPVHERHRSIRVLEEDKVDAQHSSSPSVRNIANTHSHSFALIILSVF